MWHLLLVGLCAVAAGDAQLQTLDGQTFSGALQSLDAQTAVIAAADGEHAVPVEQILQLTPSAEQSTAAPPVRPFVINLADGSELRATSLRLSGDSASIELAEKQELTLNAPALRSLRLASASEAELAQWEKILSQDQPGDLVVVRKSDAIDFVEGEIVEVAPEAVNFKVDGDLVPVKWGKIFGLVWHQVAAEKNSNPLCEAHLVDGSRLAAKSVVLAGENLSLELISGAKLELPTSDVARLDYSQGKIVYLSDLAWDARESQRAPYLGAPLPLDSPLDLFSPQRDLSFEGGPLLLSGKAYTKGLALHSRTRLVYRLPDDYRRLTALAGIDDRAGTRGDVVLRVEGDGRVLYEAPLSGAGEPVALDIDVAGVRRLAIIADYGANQDLSDHLNLCEARLVK